MRLGATLNPLAVIQTNSGPFYVYQSGEDQWTGFRVEDGEIKMLFQVNEEKLISEINDCKMYHDDKDFWSNEVNLVWDAFEKEHNNMAVYFEQRGLIVEIDGHKHGPYALAQFAIDMLPDDLAKVKTDEARSV